LRKAGDQQSAGKKARRTVPRACRPLPLITALGGLQERHRGHDDCRSYFPTAERLHGYYGLIIRHRAFGAGLPDELRQQCRDFCRDAPSKARQIVRIPAFWLKYMGTRNIFVMSNLWSSSSLRAAHSLNPAISPPFLPRESCADSPCRQDMTSLFAK
jgi:hypothetical protein